MRTLGVDPGSRFTGYGVVEERGAGLAHIASGRISLSPKAPFPARLLKVLDSLGELLKEFSPGALALEDLFYAKNVKAAFRLAHVRGVVMLAAEKVPVPVFEYAPAQVKSAVTGTGNADKRQVQKMVAALLGLDTTPTPDAADALAVAICHLSAARLEGSL